MKKYALLALLLCLALCLPALAAAEGETKPKIDVVWLIDTTGSIGSSRISAIKNKMDSFAAQLTDFDVRYSLVAFGDEANNRKGFDFPENTVWLTMGSSHWTNSCETLKSYIEQGDGKLPTYDGGDTPETSTNAIVRAARWIGNATDSETWRDGALRQFVLATDAEPKKTGTYKVQGKDVYVYSMQEAIDACLQRDISVSVASFYNSTRIENAYKDLVEKTDGTYQYVGDSTTFESLAKWIHDAPVVITQPEDQYVHEGDSVVFEAASHPVKECIFEWYHLLNGYTTSSYVGLSPKYPPKDFVSDASKQMDGMEVYCRFSNFTQYDKRSIETRHAILHVASKFAITGQPQDVTIEAGKTATFTVKATGDELTYQWQKQSGDTWVDLSGETASTLSIPATLANDGSVYRCVIKDAISDKQPDGYTLTSDPAALTVVAAPVITTDPKDVTTEDGKTATFTVKATGDGITYQWQKQSGSIWDDLSGETGASLTVNASLEISGSMYRCQVTSGYGTVVASQSAKLTVVAAPAITTDPKDVTTEEGKTATFTVKATGDGITYQWQKQSGSIWNDLPGETGTSLTVPASLENNGSVYRCQVTSSFGTVAASQPAKLTVAAAPVITAQPESITITEGEDASFTVQASGEGLKYQWQVYRNGVWMNCTDGHTPTLTLSSPALTDDGQLYRCKITSSYGTEITSDAATLTVLAKIEPPQTGDSFQMWLWAALLGASLLGLTMLRRRRA